MTQMFQLSGQVLRLLLWTVLLQVGGCTSLEELQVYGPMDLHQLSLDYFLERRRADPTETMESDSPLMQRARDQAVRRLAMQAPEDLTIQSPAKLLLESATTPNGEAGRIQLSLPSPHQDRNKEGILIETINEQLHNSRDLIVESGLALANAAAFSENVGSGALAGAGALPVEWIKLAEEKLQRDASLSHHALLWELGTEFAEQRQEEMGGVNVTTEESLTGNLQAWFEQQGGRLNFVAPHVNNRTRARPPTLVSTESIEEGEAVVKMPFRLIMCRQTARNVLIGKSGRYLGEELSKTFERNEVWGLAIFLLHEYYKEVNGGGSKWGPFLRTLRMRYLSTSVMQALRGTVASALSREWIKSSDKFMWWSIGMDGPCVPTLKICHTKPRESGGGGDSRYNIHQIRWAYWIVKQNAVRVRQASTGLSFLALVPFFPMMDKALESEGGAGGAGGGEGEGGVVFELDGTVTIRAAKSVLGSEEPVPVLPGRFSDAEFFLRYMSLPAAATTGSTNFISLKLPGTLPKGSKFLYCLKGTQKQRGSDECTGNFRAEAMFWKSQVLAEWRRSMNLPPRMQELRMWATRLHLYGAEPEEARLQSAVNHVIAGLPIPVEDMSAEEQLMLMGAAGSTSEAAVMLRSGGNNGEAPAPPQLYSAPDAQEDPEAQRAMEELAFLAAQAQNSIVAGNVLLNATMAVLNRTRDFFQHGVLPMAGLDELDELLLKKIGMLAHCGFENDMKITAPSGNVTDELLCAMRVHLMNETEMQVFCPADARAWQENCHDVEFLNFTAISSSNEALVVAALRSSVQGLLAGYPSTKLEDEDEVANEGEGSIGEVMRGAVRLRIREKELLESTLVFLDEHEEACQNGLVAFQLEDKAKERIDSDAREAARLEFQKQIRDAAASRRELPLAVVSVDFGEGRKENLELLEGQDVGFVVKAFCQQYGLDVASNYGSLVGALKERVASSPSVSPLLLMLGVIVPSGHRKILSILQGANVSFEVGVFCALWNISSAVSCSDLEARVRARAEPPAHLFSRTVLLNLPIDAPDSRKLGFIVRQGEQHDLRQLASDFLELYHMPLSNADVIAAEAAKRLPDVALVVPVSLPGRRQVGIRFGINDNITAVVEGFVNYLEVDDDAFKISITKRARWGLNPGSWAEREKS